ncbi:MAG: twin transmembrane helix small protein [Maricaulaceae bacterium]|jgi:hypothetical protein
MQALFNLAVPLAIAAVFVTLCFGIYSLMRGGEFARSHSNRLMRLRVILQFVAVLVLMGALYFATRGGA